MREEQQRDRDRVTRRSGTKMFRDTASHKNAEPIREFDEDRQRDGARKTQGSPRDSHVRDGRREAEHRGGGNETAHSGYDKKGRTRAQGKSEKERRQAHPGEREDKQTAPSKEAAQDNTHCFVHQVVPYVMFWVALFAAVSFLLRDVAGQDASVGAFGNWFADFLCGLFGIGAYFLPLFWVVLSLKWRQFVRNRILVKKILLSTSFLLLLSGIIHVFQDADRAYRVLTPAILYTQGVSRVGGGFFGGFVGEWIGYFLRLPGTCLLAIPLLVIIGIYLVGLTPTALWQRIEVKFKMLRQRRREVRGANGNKLASLTAHRPSDEGKKKEAAAWKQPQPLEGGKAYDFGDDDWDTVADPVQAAEGKRAEKVVESEPARTRDTKRPSRASRVFEADELLDFSDDESIEPSEEARTILSQAGHADDVKQHMDEILRDMEVTATAAGEKPMAREDGKESSYYAPFALPIRPEPRRERPTPTVAASSSAAVQVNEPVAVKEETPTEDDFGEILGRIRPEGTPLAYDAWQKESPVQEKELPQSSREWFDGADRAAEPLTENKEPVFENKGTPVLFFDDEPNVYEKPVREQAVTPVVEDLFLPEAENEPYFAPEKAEEPQSTVTPVAPVAPVVHERIEPSASAPVQPRVEPQRVAPIVEKTPVRDEKPELISGMHREYVRPPISLLNEDKNIRNDDFYEEIEDTKRILRDTLESFNIHIQDEVSYSHGPAVTRYELRPVAGTSVRSVTNRIEDLSLNLASSVRIEAPIPGKPAIGIEVPNKVRETVYMRTMLESREFRQSTEPLEVPLGLDVGGAIRLCNLAKMPHLLVAGTTGSGKSVCINSILLSLIYKTSPQDLRLILIDPKQIEFAPYEHVPHLYMPIVTDMQRAAGALACAVQEMERRFTLIKDVGVRNIEAYNEAVKNDPDREHLPYMVIVIDEFADLKMSCSNNDPENFTCRIAQKARAAGIHLIIGTQRPSVDVITGKLKSNIPSRIAFMVKQQVDSRTILDVNGAEALTGRGDMLYMPSNSSDKAPTRIQGAFVSDGELERVISYVRKNNDPVQYNQAFMDQIEIEMARAQSNGKKHDADDFEDDGEGSEDPKFVEAVKLAVETQKVATSLLQRRLGVGYGRAAKIIDRMEELGLVSASEGNKPRQVLAMAQGYLNHLAVEEEGASDDLYE